MPANLDWISAAGGNGELVAIRDSSGAVTSYAYSADGIKWNGGTFPSSAIRKNIAFGSGKFITIANSSNKVATSEDGITWTETEMPFSAYWKCLAYGNGKFVVFDENRNLGAYSSETGL